MGKRKDNATGDDPAADNSQSPLKKHRKHKHKKHKKVKDEGVEDVDVNVVDDPITPEKPVLKLKIKLGNKSQPNESPIKAEFNEMLSEEEKKKLKRQNHSDAEEEEAWLEALETGKLDEFDEFKRMKDPALMTARQRALLEGKGQKYPYFPEPEVKPKEMTEEMIQRKALIARKRRQQVQTKHEKEKKQTLERLLKKQEAKVKADRARAAKKGQAPKISFCYINKPDGIFYCIPQGFESPITNTKMSAVPERVKCGVDGCQNDKKYSCSQTQMPLCSLECYKKNMMKLS